MTKHELTELKALESPALRLIADYAEALTSCDLHRIEEAHAALQAFEEGQKNV